VENVLRVHRYVCGNQLHQTFLPSARQFYSLAVKPGSIAFCQGFNEISGMPRNFLVSQGV